MKACLSSPVVSVGFFFISFTVTSCFVFFWRFLFSFYPNRILFLNERFPWWWRSKLMRCRFLCKHFVKFTMSFCRIIFKDFNICYANLNSRKDTNLFKQQENRYSAWISYGLMFFAIFIILSSLWLDNTKFGHEFFKRKLKFSLQTCKQIDQISHCYFIEISQICTVIRKIIGASIWKIYFSA